MKIMVAGDAVQAAKAQHSAVDFKISKTARAYEPGVSPKFASPPNVAPSAPASSTACFAKVTSLDEYKRKTAESRGL